MASGRPSPLEPRVPVRQSDRLNPTRRISSRLVPLLALLGGLVAPGMPATGRAATSLGQPPGARAAAPHRCKCGMQCRGGSCCCRSSHGEHPARPGPTRPPRDAGGATSARAFADVNPCVRAAPCGDPGRPDDSPRGPAGRAILPAPRGALPMPASTPRPGVAGAKIARRDRADRLDDPPEGAAA